MCRFRPCASARGRRACAPAPLQTTAPLATTAPRPHRTVAAPVPRLPRHPHLNQYAAQLRQSRAMRAPRAQCAPARKAPRPASLPRTNRRHAQPSRAEPRYTRRPPRKALAACVARANARMIPSPTDLGRWRGECDWPRADRSATIVACARSRRPAMVASPAHAPDRPQRFVAYPRACVDQRWSQAAPMRPR